MARDTDDGLAGTFASAGEEGAAPPMLRQPMDTPAPLVRATDLDAVRALRQQRDARRQATAPPDHLRARARAWAGRVTGRADRRYLHALGEAVDALVAHSDAAIDRLNLLAERESDVDGAFGSEISRLRAEVIHLRDLVSKHDQLHR